MVSDRERLRATFDSAAPLYQQARPEYPDALYEELARLAALRPGAHLLEIGCATGKATIPLAGRGFRITCLEIGACGGPGGSAEPGGISRHRGRRGCVRDLAARC